MPPDQPALNLTLPAAPLPRKEARWALLLDVDGTLLDFKDDPAAVVAPPSLVGLLHGLRAALNGALALVSGRGLDDLDRIFGRAGWSAAGLHGLEVRHADGSICRGEASAASLKQLRQMADQLAAQFADVRIEDKHRAIALHCRQDPDQLAALNAAATAMMPGLPNYELQPGRQVLEIKPAGVNKGEAVSQLLSRAPFLDRTPVYLGDDLTDEHAFTRVNLEQGISVRVGSREPSDARFTLHDPAAVTRWLGRVLNALSVAGLPR